MAFDRIYLDRTLKEQLCFIGLKEGWIKNHVDYCLDGDYQPMPPEYAIKRKLFNKKKLLLYLTLFEKIDGVSTIFDLSRLKSEGLVDSGSRLLLQQEKVSTFDTFGGEFYRKLPSEEKSLIDTIQQTSAKIISLNSMRIAKSMRSEFLLRRDNQIISSPKEWDYNDRIPSVEIVEKMTKYIADDNEVNKWKTNFFEFLKVEISYLHDELIQGLFFSIKNKSVFASAHQILNTHGRQSDKINEDLEYIIKIKLLREANVLPDPDSFEDVLRYRNRKEIIRFREVVSNWLSLVKDGNVFLVKKIEKDIIKANKELIRLEKWKKFQDSDIYFIINSIGGYIPILSNILTAFYSIGHLVEKQITKKNSWVMINR